MRDLGRRFGATPRRWQLSFLAITCLVPLSLLLCVGWLRVSAAGPTGVSGVISGDTTWSTAESPYVVTGSILVQPGVTLTIEAGVAVRFDSGKGLVVEGGLVARGTEASPIVFTSNQASPARGDWAYIMFSGSAIDAVLDEGGEYVSGSILQYCTVEYAGNGSKTPAVKIVQSAPLIDHCTVRENDKNGIYIEAPDDSLVISNSVITNNTTASSVEQIHGGGIYVNAENVLISHCTVGNNRTNYYGDGGGIYGTGTVNISYCNVANNYADSDGGGIYGGSTVNIDHCTISGNQAAYAGGGVRVGGTVAISHCDISSNKAGSGGGIYASGTVDISHCTVTNNSSGGSGGIYAFCFDVRISDCVISGNSATGGGGGVGSGTDELWSVRRLAMSNCIIMENTAGGNGGGIALGRLVSLSTSAVSISKNSAGGSGGGIGIVIEGSPTVSDCTIVDNIAGQRGGGIFGDAVTAEDCIIRGNSAPYGGGIYAQSQYRGVTVSRSEITGNSATAGQGGGIDIHGHSPINHNEIHGNTPYDVSNSNAWGTEDADCTNNWWGNTDEVAIQAQIWDWSDDATVGIVNYSPWLGFPPPWAYDHEVTTAENTPAAIALSAADVGGDNLTYSVLSEPANGTLSGTAPELTYTPNADYVGPDSFTFRVNDGETDSNVATVRIVVKPDTTAPAVSGVQAIGITATSATIVWTTDEPADSQVDYGLTTEYGSSTTLDSNLVTSHSVNLTDLTHQGTYHYRVKSTDGSGNQACSADLIFNNAVTLPNQAPNQPSNSLPDNGATGMTLTPTLMSSAFSDADGGAHFASQWQVTFSFGDYSNPVFDSGSDVSALTEITLPEGVLRYDTAYYWRVRYQDSDGHWSAWSSETSFVTVASDEADQADRAARSGGLSFWAGIGIGIGSALAIGCLSYLAVRMVRRRPRAQSA